MPGASFAFIGSVDGAPVYLFDRIRGIVALGNQNIVVADRGTNTIRWYDPSGNFLFERGGTGQGPGEFRSLGGITVDRGDTIVAVDPRSLRITLFSAQGEVAGTVGIQGAITQPGKAFRLSDATFITGNTGFGSVQLGSEDNEAGFRRFPSPIVRVGSDTGLADTLGVFPGMEIRFLFVGGSPVFGPHAYGETLMYAVRDDQIYVGTGERLEVRTYRPDGTLSRILRVKGGSLDLTDAEIDGYLASAGEALQAALDERDAGGARIRQGIPDARPAFSALVVDQSGSLWIGEHVLDGAPSRRWLVFDSGGRQVGRIVLPGGFIPHWISETQILGRSEDELGVEYVVRFELAR